MQLLQKKARLSIPRFVAKQKLFGKYERVTWISNHECLQGRQHFP